jgi:hypothetical protein
VTGTLAGMGRAFQPYSGGVTVKLIALMEVMRTDVTVSSMQVVHYRAFKLSNMH